MVKTKKVGLDGGNGLAKAYFEGSNEGILIPSIRWENLTPPDASALQLGEFNIEELEDNLDITFVSSKALAKNGERYYIGNAVTNRRLPDGHESDPGDKKYMNSLTVHMMLTALLIDAIKSNPGKKTINAKYDLSLALPLIDMSKENYNLHANRLIGHHELIFHCPNGEDTIKVNIEIEFATTLPEGAIGAYAIVYDEKANLKKYKTKIRGELQETTFDNMPLLLNDIGGGTSEHAFSIGIKFNPNLSWGSEFGAKQTIAKICEAWGNKPENSFTQIKTATEFTKIYTDKSHYLYNALREHSKEFIKNDAQKIVSDVISRFHKINDGLTRIVFYGGGALLFEEEIRRQITEKHPDLIDNLIFIEDPIFTNARGLLNFSLTKAFENRKSAALEGTK